MIKEPEKEQGIGWTLGNNAGFFLSNKRLIEKK